MLLIETFYFIGALLLAVYGFSSILYAWVNLRRGRPTVDGDANEPPATKLQSVAVGEYPHVTVQLPVYNERHVAARLIDAVAALQWPAERLHIQILDDSTDDTTQIVAAAVARHAGRGIRYEHVRRAKREGYKAGALQHGMATVRAEYVAIFDADFVPAPDFLTRTIPHFIDPVVGCVQARWGHLNRDHSLLTRAQALGMDGHFRVEQPVRHLLRAYLNFNGTAGVWRRACIDDAGGWTGDTLTEDLDLSYRAQLMEWRIDYVEDVVAPAELPIQIEAYKRQQFRWAKGSIQTAIKHLANVVRGPGPAWRKLLGALHLTNYAVHPLMLLNLLLLLPISLSHSALLLITPLLTVAALGPPLLYWSARPQALYSGWALAGQTLALMALGAGLSLNNARAAFEAVFGIRSEFKRTPKFAANNSGGNSDSGWQRSEYALFGNAWIWTEAALSAYAFGLLVYSVVYGLWWVLFWVLLYAVGFGYVAWLGFRQAWELAAARQRAQPRATRPLRAKVAEDAGGASNG